MVDGDPKSATRKEGVNEWEKAREEEKVTFLARPTGVK